MQNGRLLILAKAPIAGLAKSRLIPALGAEGAANLQGHFIRHTLATAQPLQGDVELWCAPHSDHPVFAAAARDYRLTLATQQGDDLGARMAHALATGLAAGGPVVLIGTDCPMLTSSDLAAAFASLHNGYDAVVGPSADGGYYLIGLNRPAPQLFAEMVWSTDTVLAETRRRLQTSRLRWQELRTLYDIDTPDDLVYLPDQLKQAITL